jgi:hypothetical protein
MPIGYIMPVVGGNERDSTSMKVFNYQNYKAGKVTRS